MQNQQPKARLLISSPGQSLREEVISHSVSIGQASDNLLRLRMPGVADYHVMVTARDGKFWLLDLGGGGETTINGVPVLGERLLEDGAQVTLGGLTQIEFRRMTETPQPAESVRPSGMKTSTEKAKKAQPPRGGASKAGSSRLPAQHVFSVVMASAGLALLLFVPFYWTSKCHPELSILSPAAGELIRESALLRLNAEKPDCLARVVYWLGDRKIGETSAHPYELRFDLMKLRTEIPDLAGREWQLSATGEDSKGNELAKTQVSVRFAGGLSSERLLELTNRFAKGIAPNQQFDPEFLEAINRRTMNYSAETLNAASANLRDINENFKSVNFPSQLGLFLAMSRSRFQTDAAMSSGGEALQGFWRLPKSLLKFEDHGSETLLAVHYTKDLLAKLSFRPDEHDYIYVVGCFGMPWEQVSQINEVLHANADAYHNFWRMKRMLPQEATDRVVEFFAAGIVGYFPREFGLRAKSLAPEEGVDEVAGR